MRQTQNMDIIYNVTSIHLKVLNVIMRYRGTFNIAVAAGSVHISPIADGLIHINLVV